MADIFISYAREDQAHADRIARALEAEGWSVWWDVTIPAGRTFDRVIEEAIEAARCVVVLWSTTSAGSEWVREEADDGRRRGILIPVQIEHGVQIPFGFRRIQVASLVGWGGAPTDVSFRRLVRDISALLVNEASKDEQRSAPTTFADATMDADPEPDLEARSGALAGPGEKAPTRDLVGKVLRNFRIVSVIGEGDTGVVYLAEHLGLPKRFAIKSLSTALSGDPSFRGRFYAEAQKQALLDDPNIVQVTDFFEDEGQFFLVMEYVDGQDLSRLIKARRRLSESEVVAIFQDILKGLGYAHAKGVVHRDMKPSNVLIDKSDRARMMNFGIAIMAGAGEEWLIAAGGAVGSPWYMSPEQIERPRKVDQRSDIYALGIVLYEMLTGDVPFDGETDFSVQYQQVKSPAPDPREKNPDISAAMAQVVLKAMAKDPSERFQNCHEFVEALSGNSWNASLFAPRKRSS